MRPNITSPAITALLMRPEMSAFSQTVSVTHSPFRLTTFNAVTGPPSPQTITDWPYSTGVIEFVKLGLANGRSQRSWPVATSTPTSLPWVIVTS